MEMEFVDRVADHLNRRKLTIISQTPTEIIADISRAEGDVETQGTPLTADNLKAIIEIIEQGKNITLDVENVKTTVQNLADQVSGFRAAVENVEGQYYDLNALIYPVGSVYISAKEGVSPAALFGGEWEQIKDAFLLASSDLTLADALKKYKLGTYGGEEQHVLTEAEMPMHSHMGNYTSNSQTGDQTGLRLSSLPWTTDLGSYDMGRITGGGQAHNNMPPYITVNVWWRRA